MHKLYCTFVKLQFLNPQSRTTLGSFYFCKMESIVLAATMALLSLLAPSASQEVNTTFPLTYCARAAEGGEQVCSPDEERQRLQDITHNELSNLLRNSLPALVRCSDRNLGQLERCPAASCSDIDAQSPTLRPSGFYWIRSSSGTVVQVYCDMDRVCGCTGGWTRVAYLNMTDPSQQCPSAWPLQTRGSEPRRLCGRTSSSSASCDSVTYSTFGVNYSRVCGRVIGYQSGTPDAFWNQSSQTIEGDYVDGVSLTHGPPGARQHIWTFAGGLVENNPSLYPLHSCPCADRAQALALVPSFVGNDYFCESGDPASTYTFMFFPNEPLWDGQGCGAASCCELNYPPGVTPPWFCKQLPQATTDDIEVRLCGAEGTENEDTPVQLIELYIN